MKVDRKKRLRNFSTIHIVDFSSDFIVVPNEDILLMDMGKGETYPSVWSLCATCF